MPPAAGLPSLSPIRLIPLPDLLWTFNWTDPDAIRFDSIIDTNGTVLSGFHWVDVRSLSGDWTDFKIVALADNLGVVDPRRGFGPSSTEQILFRAHFHQILPIPPSPDRKVIVTVDPSAIETNFASTEGRVIGIKRLEVPGTLCFRCLSWSGSTCLAYIPVDAPPCDSTALGTDTISVIDTSLVSYVAGSVTTHTNCPRSVDDIDINGDGVPMTVRDEVTLIKFVDGDTSGVYNSRAADLNGDCIISWADIYLMDSLFRRQIYCNGQPCPPLPCACRQDSLRRECCWERRGNINGDFSQTVDLADLSYLVNYLTVAGTKLGCPEEANLNGVGTVDIADLSYLVAFLTGPGAPPVPCPGWTPPQ